MRFKDKFQDLAYLLRAYFFVDWRIEHSSEEDAVRAFVNDLSYPEVQNTIKELDQFIALELKEPELYQAVCEDMDSGYYPDTDYKDVNDWLRWVRDTLAKYAAEKAAQEYSESSGNRG